MVFNIDASAFRRFVILLYKGLLIRKRHYIITAFEIVIPVLVASVPAIIQSQISGPYVSTAEPRWVNDSVYSPFDPFKAGSSSYSNSVFAYAPNNSNTRMLMEDSVTLWKKYNYRKQYEIRGLKDGNELENYCMSKKREDSDQLIIGTLFNNIDSTSDKFPPNLDYMIRYGGSYDKFKTDMKFSFYSFYNTYSDSYFLSWQAAVEKSFIQKKMTEAKQDFKYELWMQQFPFPGHKASSSSFSLSILVPIVIIYGFMVFIINLLRRVIEEKANGSKELLKMMGMTDFIYWFSTFLNYFFVGALVVLIVSIVYKVPLQNSTVVLKDTDFTLLFIILLLFVAHLILFCLAVTTFFNKATFGIIVMMIFYNVCYSLFQAFIFVPDKIEETYYPLSPVAKFCICFIPAGAIFTVGQMLLGFEASGEGMQWRNLYSFDAVPDFNVSLVMIAILFSCLLYVVIIWYVDAVWPWQLGVPKPFYFPFTKNYWCGYEEGKADDILLGSTEEINNSDFFEEDPTVTSPGVVIKNLSKVFRTGLQTKVAVNNVSLNIYNGQITALLGHNGAGKTTTINILTGLYSPSSGTASVNGYDIFSHTTKARQSLGVCPQHNVLYDTLTVEEHLKIYAALKGVSWKKLDEETNSILTLLFLADKKTELAKNLSGGMKRKLSLGIALIGGSKVLFLDEPTSGMDVEARRSVWDALLNERHNRTIVLTTHYMEEADILGDRIAIMADGEIQCCGSPLYLKKKFGTGYHLHLVKKENFDVAAVRSVLQKYLPDASLENDYEGEVTFNLKSNTHANFGTLFKEIETNKNILGVNSCGITVTTMEDVFLNVANIADLKIKTDEKFSLENADEIEMKDIYVESNEFGKSKKLGNQFLGLILKRWHYAKRYWFALIPQIILPFVIMCVCFSVINVTSYQTRNEPSLKLDIKEVYGQTDSFYHSDGNSSSDLLAAELKTVLQGKNAAVNSVDDPQKFVLNYGKKSISHYYKKLIVGGNIDAPSDQMNVTAWFNNYPYHALPMSLLLMNTAILRNVTKSGSITLTNYPLPDIRTYYYEDTSYTKERILANVFAPLAFSFLSASFVLLPIHERTTKAKLLQMMTGISSLTYWASMFVWDFATSIIASLFLIIPFSIFSHYAFFSPHSEAIGTAILMMILYGWSAIPFSYLFSLIFKKPNTGFSIVNFINVFTGVAVCSIFSTILQLPGVRENSTAKAFSWILKFFPSFALSSGFANLFAISYGNAFCDTLSPEDLKYNCEPGKSSTILKCCKDICGNACFNETYPITMDENGCGRDILFLFLDGLIYFVLLIFLESFLAKKFIRYCTQQISMLRKVSVAQIANGNFTEDSDVLQEEERVRNNIEQVAHSDALVALNLSKTFKSIKAVDRLTFGIHKKECFGLLGVNGAGKTTTFRMLTGDCYPTEGNALVDNCSVINDLKKFQSYIGYCPQFDALIDRLSAREMITLFARLRGLNGAKMTRYVNALIKMTDLTKYADKPSMVYSGGNKRKLSIALALIGAPPLLLLDEPTAGVDPVSRRKIWKILSLARIHSGAAVILTTHSMEESEALCSRLAIMVNGRFRCLGSIQQLKSKFGQGYTLIIKLKREEQDIPQSMDAVKAFINSNLPGSNLKDDHQGMLQYHVVDPSVTLSYLFKFMDGMKTTYNLEDYVVSDTSLEQIFLAFARLQRVVAV